MSTPTENQESCEELTQKLREAVRVMEEYKDTDSARSAKADEERGRLAGERETMKEKINREEREKATAKATADMEAFLKEQRSAPKDIANVLPTSSRDEDLFFVNVAKASNSRNPCQQAEGKAA